MIFSSIYFLSIFLPLFLLCFYLFRESLRKWVILFFSALFYAWGAPIFFYFLLASSILDFWFSDQFSSDNRNRKKYLWCSLILNVGLLAYFKYFNFFISNVSSVSQGLGYGAISFEEVVLPIGISFFTFQKISYSLDVYWGKSKRLNNFFDYLLYIIMFPQLIAGPIVRYQDVSDQIINYSENKLENKLKGLYRFIIGLSKKVLLANTFAMIVGEVNVIDLSHLSFVEAWLGMIAYTFQIYYDFAGYSDMAIGLGLMIGFSFPENFNFPYLSKSITEFWQRWHITLGSWIRDYLYIPLGGNRKSTRRVYFNLVFVFFISGFWHGAAWNFIVWGIYHGLFLMIERAWLGSFLKKLPKIIQVSYTFFVVMIGWVFFSNNVDYSFLYIKKLFEFSSLELSFVISFKTTIIILIGFVFAFGGINNQLIDKLNFFPDYSTSTPKKALVFFPLMLALFVLSYLSLMTSGFNPFIYYRF